MNALNAVMDKIDEVAATALEYSSSRRFERSSILTCSQIIDHIEKLISISQYDSSQNYKNIVELSSVITESDVDKETCTTEDISLLKRHKLSLQLLVTKYPVTAISTSLTYIYIATTTLSSESNTIVTTISPGSSASTSISTFSTSLTFKSTSTIKTSYMLTTTEPTMSSKQSTMVTTVPHSYSSIYPTLITLPTRQVRI